MEPQLEFFSYSNDRQSKNINAASCKRTSANPVIDFHESIHYKMLFVFSEAYKPLKTATLLLINLPTVKAG